MANGRLSFTAGAQRAVVAAAAGTGEFVPSPDGQRFLVNLPAGGESASGAEPITVVTNWQAGRAR